MDTGQSTLFMISAGTGKDHARGGLESMASLHLQILKDQAKRRGLDGVPGLDEALEQRVIEWTEEFEADLRIRGVALHIQRLLSAPSKSDAVRIASAITITHQEFSDLVTNAPSQLGYRHRMKFKEFRPPHHRAFSDQISKALQSAEPGKASPEIVKAMRKVTALFDERKRVHVHLLEKGAKWHAFFFDFNDMTDPKVGPHIHYVSHRWADLTREIVWDAFDIRRQSLPREVHIRYIEPAMSAASKRKLNMRSMPTNGHVLQVDGRG
jgi:hypothetical protein